MRRTPSLRQENQVALALAEIERLKAITTRTTDGRVIVTVPGTTPGDGHTPGGELPPLETSAHVLYGSKHTNSFRVSAAEGVSLTIFVGAGQTWAGGAFVNLAATTLQMTDAATNYVHITSAGVIASNTSSFPLTSTPLAEVVAAGGTITAVNDRRSYLLPGAGTSGSLHDADQIIDADGDTSVEVERGVDDDTIRLKAATVDVALIASAGQWQLPIQGSGAGILVGGDVQWYRDAANEWRTPDSVRIDANLRMANGQYLSWLSAASAQINIMRYTSGILSLQLEQAQWRWRKDDNTNLAVFSLGSDPVFQFYRNMGIDRSPEGAGTQAINTMKSWNARSVFRFLRKGGTDTRIKFDIGLPNDTAQDPTMDFDAFTGAVGAEVGQTVLRLYGTSGGAGGGVRIPQLGAYGDDNQFRVGSATFGGNIHVYFDSHTDDTAATTYIEFRPQMVAVDVASDTAVTLIGAEPQAGIHASSAVNFTGKLIAERSRVKLAIAAGKTVTLAIGHQAYCQINPSGETGILTEWRAFDVGIRQVGGGSIVDVKGLYIPDISAWGTGLNIAIQSLGGEHRFVGGVKIGADSTPTEALDVVGNVLLSGGLGVGTPVTSVNRVSIGDTAFYMQRLAGADPLISWDGNDFSRYLRSSNAFEWNIAGLQVMRLEALLFTPVVQGNAAFSFSADGTTTNIKFDAGDVMQFVNGTNLWNFQIGASNKFIIDSAGRIHAPITGVSAGLLLGGDALLYRNAADILATPDELLVSKTLSLASLVPATVGSAADNQKLLTFGIDRAWVFEAIGVGASSQLGLRALNDQKYMAIQSADSTDCFKFFAANSAAATLLTITGSLFVSLNVEIDGDLNHDGSNVGFYGTAPAAKPGATSDLIDGLLSQGLVTAASAVGYYGNMYARDVADLISIGGTGVGNKEQVTSFAVDGEAVGTVPDHTNDHITITHTGKYLVTVAMAVESAAGLSFVAGYGCYTNDGTVALDALHGHRNMAGGGGEHGSITMSGIVALTAADTLEVWVWNETNTVNIIMDDISLSVVRVGD